MYPEFEQELVRRDGAFGCWPVGVLERHPEVSAYLAEQGLDSSQIDQVLLSVLTGNWDLTSAHICGTGHCPLAEERPHFLADYLVKGHPSWLSRSAYLEFGQILLAADLI